VFEAFLKKKKEPGFTGWVPEDELTLRDSDSRAEELRAREINTMLRAYN
jgi:hypothetical protein